MISKEKLKLIDCLEKFFHQDEDPFGVSRLLIRRRSKFSRIYVEGGEEVRALDGSACAVATADI